VDGLPVWPGGISLADRSGQIEDFLQRAGWVGVERRTLAADASFRRYDRLLLGSRRAVLMDAPPPKEDVRPFLRVGEHLTALGYSAPRILARNEEAGFLLLEDLGDDTFTRLLAAGADEAGLYRLATDLLIDLHRRPAEEAVPAGLPRYDDDRLVEEAALLTEWYMPAIDRAPVPDATNREYRDLWRMTLRHARHVPESLVLRDYHVDNLMRLPEREGVAACGLLDFQDAVRGPVTYDLVSLLEDARRDIDTGIAAEMTSRYLDAFPELDHGAFKASMAILGAQRHAKVIGIFTRLCRRDGKPDYLAHIPRVWKLFERACAHPSLGAIRHWIDAHIPPHRRGIPPEAAA